MSHSSTSRRRHDAPAAAREADRVAAGAQAARAACGAGRSARRGGRARGGACAAAASPARGASSAGRAAPARRARARRSACRAAAPRRWPAPAGTSTRRASSLASPSPAPRAQAAPGSRRPSRARGPRRARGWPSARRRRRSTVRTSSRSRPSSDGRAAEHRAEHARRRRATCAGSETNTARAVQYSRRRQIGRTSASACAKRTARSGVTGTPASCRRRLERAGQRRAGRARSSRPRSAVIAPPPAARGRPRGSTSWSSRVLEHRAERAVDRGGVERLDAEQAQRRQPVDRLGDPGRLLHVGVAHPRDRVGHLDGERLRRALDPPADDLDLALRASGSRSTGTGSGA